MVPVAWEGVDGAKRSPMRIAVYAAAVSVRIPAGTRAAAGVVILPDGPATRRQSLRRASLTAILPGLRAIMAAHQDDPDERHIGPIWIPALTRCSQPRCGRPAEQADMHWSDAGVNRLLALRNAVWNDCWDGSRAITERELRHNLASWCSGSRQTAVPQPCRMHLSQP